MEKNKKSEVVEKPIKVNPPKKEVKPSWEIKDRRYYLNDNKEPLTFTIPSKHTRKHSLLILTLSQVNKENLDMLLIKILLL